MPDNAGENTDGVAHEIENFLNKWNPLPEQEGKSCPPDYILLAVARENDNTRNQPAAAADVEQHPPPKIPDKWRTHIKDCDHCRQIVQFLGDTQRPPISMGVLLAQASMEAQKQKAAAQGAGRSRSGYGGVFLRPSPREAGGLYARLSRLATPLAAAAVLVFMLWAAGTSVDFFKQPDERAEVSFQGDKREDLARRLEEKVSLLKKEPAPAEKKPQLIEDYQQQLKEYERLKQGDSLSAKDRGDIATLLAVYRQKIDQLPTPTPARGSRAPETPMLANTADTQDPQLAKEILQNVGQELIKKNVTGEPQSIPPVSEEAAFSAGFENVRLEINVVNGVTDINVNDRAFNRPPEEKERIIRGLQRDYGEQSDRRDTLRLSFNGSPIIGPR